MPEQTAASQSCSSASSHFLVSVSIVSHGQANLVGHLLADLAHCGGVPLEVILTLNLNESLPFPERGHPFPLKVIRNPRPKGFGANHNAAFRHAEGDFFCVLNPDIRLSADPFPILVESVSAPHVGIAAPLIRAPGGGVEDSARRFPTPFTILSKLAGRLRTADYPTLSTPFTPDWVAGMFMLFRSDTFRDIGGFDEGYFLYYEDVDLCARLHRRGLHVVQDPRVECLHDARRQSHRNLRYMSWHLRSMLRFFALRALGRR